MELSNHSKRNLLVIENFILYLTHCSDENDSDFTIPQTYTPEELYRVAYDYITEDHADGEEYQNQSATLDYLREQYKEVQRGSQDDRLLIRRKKLKTWKKRLIKTNGYEKGNEKFQQNKNRK